MPRTTQPDQGRRRLGVAATSGWLLAMGSLLVGLVDGPDDLRDGLLLIAFAVVVAVIVVAVRTRYR